ncbi:MAG: GFA family protein [Alphaproteobacteria bacterium]
MEHLGGCHCGNLRLRLSLSKAPDESPLRACACSFCRAHATRTVADPAGLAELSAADWSLVERYRFGSRTADYLVCRRCGVYVAALCETSAGLRAVVNVNALDDRAAFSQPPSAMNYDGETAETRLARRAANWMPAVMPDQAPRRFGNEVEMSEE